MPEAPLPRRRPRPLRVAELQRQLAEIQQELAALGAHGPLVRVAHLWSDVDRRGRSVLKCHVGPLRLLIVPYDAPQAIGATHALLVGTTLAGGAPRPEEGHDAA